MAEWTLIPQKGIEHNEVTIHFGMPRSQAREVLSATFPAPQSHFDDEDDFEHETDGTLIRLRYDDSGVRDIEFLAGSLNYSGVTLFGGEWPDVQQGLAALGNTFRDTQWLGDGFDCLPLAINIATREQIGGDGAGIEWIILSSKFQT